MFILKLREKEGCGKMQNKEIFIYQENHEKVNDIIQLFKKYDVRMKDDIYASCIAKVTFLKTYGEFEKGMEFLWIKGRKNFYTQAQLFDLDHHDNSLLKQMSNKEINLIKSLRFFSMEEFSYIKNSIDDDFDEYIKIDYLELESPSPSNMKEIMEFVNMIKPEETVEDEYDSFVCGVEFSERMHLKIGNACLKFGFPLVVGRENSKIGYINSYFIYGHCIAYFIEPMIMTQGYRWTILFGNDYYIRKFAKSIFKGKQTS